MIPGMATREELAAAWRAGDSAARFQLLAACFPEALKFARSKGLLDEQLATDVIQDLFGDLERRRHEGGGILAYTPPKPFRPWFLSCLKNAIGEARRRNRRRAEVELRGGSILPAPAPEPGGDPPADARRARGVFETLVENPERLARTRRIFDRLSQAQRSLIRSYLSGRVTFLPAGAEAGARGRNSIVVNTRRAVISLARLWGVLVKKEIPAPECGRRVVILIDLAIQTGHLPPGLWE